MFGWIFTPAGRIGLLVLALVSWTAYQRHDAAGTERARLMFAYQKATDEEVSRQAAASSAAIAAADQRVEAAETKARELQDVADQLKAEVQKAGIVCPLSDDLRKRLLTIH